MTKGNKSKIEKDFVGGEIRIDKNIASVLFEL